MVSGQFLDSSIAKDDDLKMAAVPWLDFRFKLT
jgi:hypothetical protein